MKARCVRACQTPWHSGQIETMSDLEKYLKGEPLTEDLARLQRGEEAGVPVEQRIVIHDFRATGSLDDDDREHLRRLSLEPGWAVLLKLLDTDMQKSEDAMKVVSLDRPLANPSELASGWADVAKMKEIRTRMVQLIDAEVQKLGKVQ